MIAAFQKISLTIFDDKKKEKNGLMGVNELNLIVCINL